MNAIRKQVSRARRRWLVGSFLHRFSIFLFIALSIAAGAWLVPKFVDLPWPVSTWNVAWLAAAVGVSVLLAGVAAFWNRPSLVNVATELDLRLKLRERLSSALQLNDEERETAMGKAVIFDASHWADRIDVREALPIQMRSQHAMWLVPVVALLGSTFLPERQSTAPIANAIDDQALTQVKNSADDILKEIKKKQQSDEDSELADADDFYKQLESKLEDLKKSTANDPKKLLTDINKLKESLESRRDTLGGAKELQKQLAGMKSMENGPADKMAESLKNGDLDQASDEVQSMMEKLEAGQLSSEQASKLANQMAEMANALEQAAKAHQAEADALEKQLQEAKAAGDPAKAAEVAKKLAENAAKQQAMEKLKELSEKMRNVEEALKKGDQKKANQSMSEINEAVKNMQASEKELSELDKFIEATEACKNCANGQCENPGDGEGKRDQKIGTGDRQGFGRGSADQTEQEPESKTIESQVRAEMKQGETVYGGKTGGVNRKGQSREEIQQSILTSELEEPDALESLPLPKKQREQTREYYDQLRTGK